MAFGIQIFRICKYSRFTASCDILRMVVGRIIDSFMAIERRRNASIMSITRA